MKKILALIVALGMTTAMFAGCSEDESSTAGTTSSSSSSAADSSSEAESSKAEDPSSSSSETETTTTTSAAQQSEPDTTTSQASNPGGAVKFEDSYTYKFQQKTKEKKFAMNLKMNYMGVDMPMEFKVNGDDIYMKMSASQGSVSYVQEYYVVGGKMYILDSAKKTYSVSNNANGGMTGMTNVTPEGNYEIVSSTEENGMIVEDVKITSKGSTAASNAKYYYDKATGEPKKIDVTAQNVKSTVEVTKFEQGAQTITLPDLSGWTNKSASAAAVQ